DDDTRGRPARQRLFHAADMAAQPGAEDSGVMDFGAGNGKLRAHRSDRAENLDIMAELRARLDEGQGVDLASAAIGAGENMEDGVQRLRARASLRSSSMTRR